MKQMLEATTVRDQIIIHWKTVLWPVFTESELQID